MHAAASDGMPLLALIILSYCSRVYGSRVLCSACCLCESFWLCDGACSESHQFMRYI